MSLWQQLPRAKDKNQNIHQKIKSLAQGWGTFYAEMAIFEIMFNHMAAK